MVIYIYLFGKCSCKNSSLDTYEIAIFIFYEKILNDVNSISNEEENDEMQWGRHFVTIELINIATIINTIGHESLVDDVIKGEVRYYVVMFTKSAIVDQELATNSSLASVVNKYKFLMKMGVETKTFKHTT